MFYGRLTRMKRVDHAIQAFKKLEEQHPDVAELLKLRYFAGMQLKDAAELLGISTATAKRRWAFARAFLFKQLT